MSPLASLARQQALSGLSLTEWRALLLAVLLAIFSSSLMAVVGERIEYSLNRKGAELLGADLILQSSRPISPEHQDAAKRLGISLSSVTQLATMASHQDQFLLISLRAVTPGYPLRGSIELQPPSNSPLPGPGEIWVESAIMERLQLQLGDSLTLGNRQFRINNLILSSPDRGRGFISFNPQAIISDSELAATGLLLPGSRASYRDLFAGDPQQITRLQQQLRNQLTTGERMLTVSDEEERRGSALNRATDFLRLVAFLTLLVAGLTICLSLRRYTRSQNPRAALLRTLGLNRSQLGRLYLLQLGYLWLLCSGLGLLLVLLGEQLILYLLQDLLPQPVPAATPWLYLTGPALGLILLFGLSLPAISQLQRSSPGNLLHNQLQSSSYPSRSAYLILAGLLLLCGAAYLDNWQVSFLLLTVLLVAALILALLGSQLMQLLGTLLQPRLPLGALLMSRIRQQQPWYRIQIPVTCLLLSLLSINFLALNDMLQRWQAELPAETPDHFLINVQEWEKQPVQQLLADSGIHSQLWPIYRGRLTGLNGQPLASTMTKDQLQHSSLRRELNLTWADRLPEHNRLLSGYWQAQQPGISVEQDLADELGLKLGDRLQFDIGGSRIEAPINSFRSLRWDSFQPNFFYIFTPDLLDNLPASYITSFHLGDRAGETTRRLLQQHPTLTLIDVRQLLAQLQTLLAQLSQLSTLLLLLAGLAALLLIYATLHQELEQRQQQNALLRTLGASSAACRQLDLLELGLTGASSGLLAVVITELSLWPVHHFLLHLQPVMHPWLWLYLPLVSGGLFILLGSLSHRRQSLAQSYHYLRQQG